MTAALSSTRAGRAQATVLPGHGWRLKPLAVRVALVLAVLVPALAEGGLWVRHPLTTVVNLLVAAGAVGAGALLAGDVQQRVTGYALIASGVVRPLGWADEWVTGPGPLYSAVFGYLSITLTAWALLRYPGSSLGRFRRRFMIALASWLIGVPAIQVCVARPEWVGDENATSATWWPYLWVNRPVFDLVTHALMAGSALLAVAYLALMVRQVAVGGRSERAVRLPVAVAGMLAAVVSGSVLVVTTITGPHEEVFAIEGMAQLSVPIAFLVSFAQRRLTRLSTLVSVLDTTNPTTHLLRQLLRHNLRDPGLDLLVWSDADKKYLTVDGEPAEARAFSPGRQTIPVQGRADRPLALLVVEADAAGDSDLVDAAVAISKLALENLMLSRRLLTADYDARQLIVADLHDGAQKDLCALRVALSKLSSADPARLPVLVEEADRLVAGALHELRDLAHGVYPHTLTHAGLAAAIEETADGLDLIVHLTAPEHRLPTTVEKTLYFFASEALTNAHKHAGTIHIEVEIRQAGGVVVAEVRDDGVGGADAEGPGLARLRDRIEAHGGRLHIHSPHGTGTRVVARIPCV
ncbi:ATP-binding protein [Actinomadura sp. DC4]|uniref:sensor histidine kinase n=1 Tax=Actinomadura sp. DC4 TaxID=3055069 RepID=UPI0025B250A9|nr:ATP-binding protein [Actinomadura sp. DC4]MDN3353839.1 histidine kinase [Actinomadura sp. DC4]